MYKGENFDVNKTEGSIMYIFVISIFYLYLEIIYVIYSYIHLSLLYLYVTVLKKFIIQNGSTILYYKKLIIRYLRIFLISVS